MLAQGSRLKVANREDDEETFMVNTTRPLVKLPRELQEIIASYLPLPAVSILKLTCRHLYCVGPPIQVLYQHLKSSPDERFEYLCLLERDKPITTSLLCSNCKFLHPARVFTATERSRFHAITRACIGSTRVLQIHPKWTLKFDAFTQLLKDMMPRHDSRFYYPGSPRVLEYSGPTMLYTSNGPQWRYYPLDHPINDHHEWYYAMGDTLQFHSDYIFKQFAAIQDAAKTSVDAIRKELVEWGPIAFCPHISSTDLRVAKAVMVANSLSIGLRRYDFKCLKCRTLIKVKMWNCTTESFKVRMWIFVERHLGRGKSVMDPLWIAQLA